MKIRQLLIAAALLPTLAVAAELELALTIKDHQFTPSELKVPAGQRVKLMVRNQDSTPEEFESYTLNREKVIAPNATVPIFIGPLKPGRYPFVGEFHQKTAQGVIVAE